MKGSIENSKLPVLLKSFTFLVAPRPDTEGAHYAFPTKLGDYLASGIPTVVTSAGEVPNYLPDGVSSFIAKPGDVDSIMPAHRGIALLRKIQTVQLVHDEGIPCI